MDDICVAARFRKLKPGPGHTPEEVAASQRLRIQAAMAEIVAERGYEGVRLRTLARRAGVSSRAFYKQFASKEECFIATHDALALASARRVAAAAVAEDERAARVRAALREFAELVATHPREARLLLLEAPTLTGPIAERVRHASRLFEAVVLEAIGPVAGRARPTLLACAVAGGATGLAASLLLNGEERELPSLADDLSAWALAQVDEVAAAPAPEEPAAPPASWDPAELEQRIDDVDRRLILAAVSKLVRTEGRQNLTPERISAAAGVSRCRFTSRFSSAEECLLEAAELLAKPLLDRAFAAAGKASTWPAAVRRGAREICTELASDRFAAGLALSGLAGSGPPAVRLRIGLTSSLAGRLRSTAPQPRPSTAIAEAGVAAAWAVLERQASRRGDRRPARLAPTVASPILAGAHAAIGSPG